MVESTRKCPDGPTLASCRTVGPGRRLRNISQRQVEVGERVGHNLIQVDDTGEYRRRRSMPQIPITEEIMPPPRRTTLPETKYRIPSTVAYSQISDHPSPDENRYEDWENATQWRKEINAGADQTRLLATFGMRAKGSLQTILQEYFERTKRNKYMRHIDSFVLLMDEQFRRPTEELVLLRVGQWGEMKRNASGGFEAY